MKINNTFSFTRFINLLRQSLIHNQKLLLLTLSATSGGIFILLLLIQWSNDFRRTDPEEYTILFYVLFVIASILSAGTAFPAFRSKESTLSYLLVPSSGFEKYLLEVSVRIFLVLLLFPALFIVVFHLETWLVAALYSDFPLEHNSLIFLPLEEIKSSIQTRWVTSQVFAMGFLAMTTAFLGTSMFTRYPLIKTIFASVMIMFFYLALIYLFQKGFGFINYNVPREGTLLVPGNNPVGVLKFFTGLSLLTSLVFLFVSYLKLKEKEV